MNKFNNMNYNLINFGGLIMYFSKYITINVITFTTICPTLNINISTPHR